MVDGTGSWVTCWLGGAVIEDLVRVKQVREDQVRDRSPHIIITLGCSKPTNGTCRGLPCSVFIVSFLSISSQYHTYIFYTVIHMAP